MTPGNPPGSYLPGSDPIANPHHDVFVSSSSGFNWRSGPRGNYYLPNNPQAQDGTLLIDANNQPGDQRASQINIIVNGGTGSSAPLSAFTTQTSQTSDSDFVDIGYHYVPLVGPQLTTPCSPQETGVGVELDWSLNSIDSQELSITDFKIYRSTFSGGPYSLIDTVNTSTHLYWDANVTSGQVYYYVVTYEYSVSGTTRESPYSNELYVKAGSSPTLVAADATWDVTDVKDLQNSQHIGPRQAPFGEPFNYSTIHPAQPPLPNINYNWFEGNTWHTWFNHITLSLSADQVAHARFSFAVDNYITAYVNNHQLDYPISGHDYGYGGAVWSPSQQLPHLVAGNNEIGVVIGGDGLGGSYFSMIITTADCSLSGP